VFSPCTGKCCDNRCKWICTVVANAYTCNLIAFAICSPTIVATPLAVLLCRLAIGQAGGQINSRLTCPEFCKSFCRCGVGQTRCGDVCCEQGKACINGTCRTPFECESNDDCGPRETCCSVSQPGEPFNRVCCPSSKLCGSDGFGGSVCGDCTQFNHEATQNCYAGNGDIYCCFPGWECCSNEDVGTSGCCDGDPPCRGGCPSPRGNCCWWPDQS
jgi:hypothetical protein